jgi:hypothetical protein
MTSVKELTTALTQFNDSDIDSIRMIRNAKFGLYEALINQIRFSEVNLSKEVAIGNLILAPRVWSGYLSYDLGFISKIEKFKDNEIIFSSNSTVAVDDDSNANRNLKFISDSTHHLKDTGNEIITTKVTVFWYRPQSKHEMNSLGSEYDLSEIKLNNAIELLDRQHMEISNIRIGKAMSSIINQYQ